MLTDTYNCQIAESSGSLPRFRIQFTHIHSIINLPSISRSNTWLLLIVTILTESLHEFDGIAVCIFNVWDYVESVVNLC
jgi:hypothetical protein